jgi:starch synthase
VLSGILNGIDIAVWNPAADPRIASSYSAENLASRSANKTALQQRFGLQLAPEALLFGIVSRLSSQKGLDLVLDNLPVMLGADMQMALLGSGDHELQARFEAAAKFRPDRIGVVIGYDEDLAHLIQAGADALLVPSRFEPCGLTQLCALRYGAVPLVSRVGGLADTVIDANPMAVAANAATGIQFAPVTRENLGLALHRANGLFRDKPVWQSMQKNGMIQDVSWRHSAREYAALYRQIAGTG